MTCSLSEPGAFWYPIIPLSEEKLDEQGRGRGSAHGELGKQFMSYSITDNRQNSPLLKTVKSNLSADQTSSVANCIVAKFDVHISNPGEV